MSYRFGVLAAAALALGLGFTAQADEVDNIRAALARVLPDHKPGSIEPTPIPGVFQVEIGPEIMFVTGDGRYAIDGIVDLGTRKDIGEAARAKARLRALDSLGEKNMIIFPAANPRHTMTVFTDIDCGYCRKLHSQIAGYNAEGITVRYVFYPRAGAGSPSFDKAVNVWCADDQRTAMTDAKSGKDLPAKKCNNPVQKQMELGGLIGIQGTPALILDSGELVGGYVEPKRLAMMLDQQSTAR